jgi:hypothetical protein
VIKTEKKNRNRKKVYRLFHKKIGYMKKLENHLYPLMKFKCIVCKKNHPKPLGETKTVKIVSTTLYSTFDGLRTICK